MMDFMQEVESGTTMHVSPDVDFDSDTEAAFLERQLRDLGYL